MAWPIWHYPTDHEMLELAHILTPYVKFLSPEIVEHIVQDNYRNKDTWSRLLKIKGINPEIYLWEKSPCSFPGIRRHAGSEEIAIFKKRINKNTILTDAIAIDDNTFPKEIWAFTFTGKRFMKKGPEGFELAHLLDHKSYKNRNIVELEGNHPVINNTHPYSGLYTSLANLCYLPSSLLKPTDFSVSLRKLLQFRAVELYCNVCVPFPFGLSLNSNPLPREWDAKNFKWNDPVGDTTNIKSFLEYRREVIESYCR